MRFFFNVKSNFKVLRKIGLSKIKTVKQRFYAHRRIFIHKWGIILIIFMIK